MRLASSAQGPSVAPSAGASCGSCGDEASGGVAGAARSSSLSLQPARAKVATAATVPNFKAFMREVSSVGKQIKSKRWDVGDPPRQGNRGGMVLADSVRHHV